MPGQPAKPIKFGVTFLPAKPAEFIGWCRAAEEAGFDLIGIADSQSGYREVFVGATLCATNTERVRFGPLVINPVTRHPAVAASAAASLADLAGNRVILGIGTGDSAVHNAGADPANLAELRAYTGAIRGLYADGQAEYRGRTVKLTWGAPPVPLYIAASGPKTLEVAGEIGDGVIVLTGLLPEVIEDSLRHIRLGAERSGRGLDDLDIWWFPWAAVAGSRTEAIARIEMSLASGAKHLARFTTKGKLIPDELVPKVEEVMRRYRFDQHQQPGSDNVKLIRELGLVDYLADRLSIVGTGEECVRKIEQAAEAGARQFCMHVGFPDKAGFVRDWAREVMPAFRR